MTRPDYISQQLYSHGSLAPYPWKNDVVLQTPELLLPANGTTVCAPRPPRLKWGAVGGASFYVIQISPTSSFEGPRVRTLKTASTFYDLVNQVDARLGEEVYWRVQAIGNGGASNKSEAFAFKFDCPRPRGSRPLGGDGQDVLSEDKCQLYAVKLKIGGPTRTFCCDKNVYHGQVSFACASGDGTPAIEFKEATWTIEAAPDAGNSIEEQTDGFCIVKTDCELDQTWHLRWTVIFKDLVDSSPGNEVTFACTEVLKIQTECGVKPKDKPWLYTYPFSPGYVHPDYVDPDYSLSPEHVTGAIGGFRDAMDQGIYPLRPIWGGDASGDPIEKDKKAIIMGPVVQFHERKFEPAETHPCSPIPGNMRQTGQASEARAHLTLGCGLRVDEQLLAVKTSEIAGQGLISVDDCGLAIDPGCGIWLKENDTWNPALEAYGATVEVDREDLMGPGLYPWGYCGFRVYPGCGLEFKDTPSGYQSLNVNAADIAGKGLYGYGCTLDVKYGCGLTLNADGELVFDARSVAGPGLFAWGDCYLGAYHPDLYYDFYPGCGIRFTPEKGLKREIAVHAPDLAGYGLVPGAYGCQLAVGEGCGIKVEVDEVSVRSEEVAGWGLWSDAEVLPDTRSCFVNVGEGCGINVFADHIEVDPNDLAGIGLRPSAYGCALDVYYGCGLTLDDGGALAVDAAAIAGKGLYGYNCKLDVKYGCGLSLDEEGSLKVDVEALAGTALRANTDWEGGIFSGGYECKLDVYYGCGLELGLGGQLKVNPFDLAGYGLLVSNDGYPLDCGLSVGEGCGIKVDWTGVHFDPKQVAGLALKVADEREDPLGYYDYGCKLDVYYGCGLTLGDGGQLKVNPHDLAGYGLGAATDGYPLDCGLNVLPGCGIKVEWDGVSVDAEALAGAGLKANTEWSGSIFSGDYDCKLEVNYGCGLTIEGGELQVDPKALGGYGLTEGGYGCKIAVAEGCGIRVDQDGVHVKAKDLAGPGLWAVGGEYSCQLAVYDPYLPPPYGVIGGCGIDVDTMGWTHKVSVKPEELAGRGLSVDAGGYDCKLNVDYGCGLTLGESGTLEIKPADLAGKGLFVEDSEYGCKLGVYDPYLPPDYSLVPGCGIKFDDTGWSREIGIDAEDLAGRGLRWLGSLPTGPLPSPCGLEVATGCGLTLGDPEIRVNRSDLEGWGLKHGWYGACDIMVEEGCGIRVAEDGVHVRSTDLAGEGLFALDPPYGCQLGAYTFDPGCGINFEPIEGARRTIEVDPYDIAGDGLKVKDESCRVNVGAGCGITVDADEVSVKPADLVGYGLEVGGYGCQLQVKEGCGTKVDEAGVHVDPYTLAGPGLKASGECQLAVGYGCGIKVEGEEVSVKAADLIGPGLTAYEECGLKVDPGCGIKVKDGKVEVKASDLAGPGLAVVDPEGCQLKVDLGGYCTGLTNEGGTVRLDNSATSYSSIWGVSMESLQLSFYGCELTVELTAQEWRLQRNCRGAVVAVTAGGTQIIGGTIALPTTSVEVVTGIDPVYCIPTTKNITVLGC